MTRRPGMLIRRPAMRAVGTPLPGRTGRGYVARTAQTLYAAAKKLTPYVKKAGLSAPWKRKMGSGWKVAKQQAPKLISTDKIQEDLGTGAEMTKMHVTIGKPLRSHESKLVRSAKQAQILRFGAINPFMNTTSPPVNARGISPVGAGAYRLYNYSDTVNYFMPLHIFDISGLINTLNSSGSPSVVSAIPGYEMYFQGNGPPSNVSFSYLPTTNADGTYTSGKWIAEDTAATATSAGTQPLRQTIQNWTQARLMCYGAAKVATEFCIEFIQFNSEYLHPEFLAGNSTDRTGTGDYRASAVGWYEYYIKKYASHPIASIIPRNHKKYKVLKTIKFTLQPKLSNQTDANVGHCKTVNLFYHMNRICKYDWCQYGIDGGAIASPSTWAQNDGTLCCNTHPNARVYMTVRATNLTFVSGINQTSTDQCPSYDLVLRKKYTTLQ